MFGGIKSHVALVAFSALTLIQCSPHFTPMVTISDRAATVPDGWTLVPNAVLPRTLPLKLALTAAYPLRLEQEIIDIATPDHPRYGQHLGRRQLQRLSAPSTESRNVVQRWLQDSGAFNIVENEEWLSFDISTARAAVMLDASFALYQSPSDDTRVVRALTYSLPKHIHSHVDTVQPITRFPPRQLLQNSNVVRHINLKHSSSLAVALDVARKDDINFNNCSIFNTPTCLKQLYNVPRNYRPPQASKNVLAVNTFLEAHAIYADLAQFEEQFAPWARNKNYTWTSINNGTEDQSSFGGGEANLDVQYTLSLAYPIPIHVYSVGGQGPQIPDLDYPQGTPNEDWLSWISFLLDLDDDQLPQTISNSFAEDEQTVPTDYARKVCSMIGKLGARGVSVIAGAGDQGAGASCRSNDGRNHTQFLPQWPSTCPWVTSVGGTFMKYPEIADGLSSGGFSNIFPRPAYQKDVVASYLQGLGQTHAGLYNKSGRGFPDVAAQSENYIVIDGGEVDADSGTSASTPVVAAFVALLNAERKANGLKPLGFLNPWLYKTGWQGFTDIVDGASDGCVAADYSRAIGWNASKGWDAVTGFGTPNFRKLLQLALQN